MRVCLQHVADRDALLPRRSQQPVGELSAGGAGAVVPVQNGVNDGSLLRGRIPGQLADGVGWLVAEGADDDVGHGVLHIAGAIRTGFAAGLTFLYMYVLI